MHVKRRVFYFILALGSAATAIRCTSSSSDAAATTPALAVSGSLSLSNSVSTSTEESIIAQTVDITQYTVSCATTSTPVQTGTGAIAADGTFSVSIVGGANQPLTCYLTDSSGTKVADFLISDSANKDLNGNDSTSTSATFTTNASLGAISFDPNAGEVTVPASNIASVVATTAPAAASVFDPTGVWTVSALDFTPPGGTKAPCAASDNDCHGPQADMSLYFKMWKGVKTADSSDVYGLQLWQSESKFTSCGSKIGLTPAVKTSLGVDFTSHGASDDVFSLATSVASFADSITSTTGTVNLTNNWKMSTATLLHDLQPSCGPHDITAGSTTYTNAWVCGPDAGNSNTYQAQLGGGCTKNSDSTKVNVQDWSGISCNGSVTTDADGIKSNTCTGNTSISGVSTAVTCSNKWTIVNSSYVVQPSGVFNWSNLSGSVKTSGTACSAIGTGTEALKIATLQCYAEYFERSGFRNTNACLPQVNMDWSASTAAAFEKVDLIRPEGLIFFEQFKPFPDGSGGTMTTRQEQFNGVQVGDSWVNCRVIETGALTIKKVSDTKALATYQSAEVTTSVTKPACLAKFTGARETFMFYINK